MMGSKPPEPPDRATPDAHDLTKTRYGDPYSPPSAAGSPSPNAAPNSIAVQPVRAVSVGAAPPAATRPARASDSEPPAASEPPPRTSSPAERGAAKPPALPGKRRSADSAPPDSVPPSAASSAAPIEPEARQTPEPERARGGVDGVRSTLGWGTPPSPRLRMSRSDVFVPNPSLARRVYPRDTLNVPPPRRWSLWPVLSLAALGVSVVALGVAIATLAPRSPARSSKATAGHAAATITDHSAATQAAGDLAPMSALPEGRPSAPLTAAEPAAPRPIHRDAAPRRPHVEQLPPPVPVSASKRRAAGPDPTMIAELEREARDRLAEADYAAAKGIYERLRAAVPARREYAAMVDLLTTRLASCGQPGAAPCSNP